MANRGDAGSSRVAQVWLTTADQTRLLARQPDVPLRTRAAVSSSIAIQVDATRSYQEMVGFGAAVTDASARLIQRLPARNRDAIMRELFARDSGIGLSFIRVPMGASDFSTRHYSYDDMPAGAQDSALAHFSIAADRAEKLPMLRAALALNPDLKIVASPWSAPAWMKTSGSLIKGTLRRESYASFADYFRRFIADYAAAGVPIFAITLQNEPAYEPDNYPGMRLDPPARAELIGGHFGPSFAAHGIPAKILDWDHNWDVPASPLAVLADSTARRYVGGVAWHCYAGDIGVQDSVHAAYPAIDTYFTECSGGGWATNFGDNLKFDVGKLIIGSTRGWAKGVALWNLALDERSGPHLGGCDNCRGVITIDSGTGAVTRNVEYYALAHASAFVRPGARRIASTSDVGGLQSVAFRNGDDGSLVLIVLNGAATAVSFDVRSGTGSFPYALPSGAVVTLRWR
jgi:glucosylceramidase